MSSYYLHLQCTGEGACILCIGHVEKEHFEFRGRTLRPLCIAATLEFVNRDECLDALSSSI